jgi:hypothetical protein
MSTINKGHQYTLTIGINSLQLAEEKNAKLRKASHRRLVFEDLRTQTQWTLDLFTKYITVLSSNDCTLYDTI